MIGTCSHRRAYKFFAESLLSRKFKGIYCPEGYNQISDKSCKGNKSVIMGGDVWSYGARGVYFVEINNKFAFLQLQESSKKVQE